MKNETVRTGKSEGKAGLTVATLPWWAKALIAQRSGEGIPSHHLRHMHHCVGCDCVMICTNKECKIFSFSMSCPECSKNKRSSQEGN